MPALISHTLWTREEAPDSLLLELSGEESWSEWLCFVQQDAPAILARLRARLILRLSPRAWADLTQAGESGELDEALGASDPSAWRLITLLTPPCSTLRPTDSSLLLALKERSMSVCLGRFELKRPAISLLTHASGAELNCSDLGRDLVSNLSLRLSQNNQWSFLSQTDSRGLFTDLAKLGCGPFQGSSIFERAMANGSGKPDISARKVLRLLNMAYAEADLSDIEEEIKQDAALSYKLISLLNSATLKTQRSVGSAREALMMLGYSQLTQWLSLLLLSSSPSSVKKSALRFSMARRAKFCELLDESAPEPQAPGRAFVCGLLSGMDALFDAPMSALIQEAGLPEDISLAIESRKGHLGALLACSMAHEQSSAEASAQLDELGFSPSTGKRAQTEALLWALSSAPFGKV